MATERERNVQSRIIKLCRKHGAYTYKNAQGMYTEKGRPDLTACVPIKIKTLVETFGEDASIGVFVGIEVKREGHLKGVSEAQEIVGRQIQQASGLWFLVDDSDVMEAILVRLQK